MSGTQTPDLLGMSTELRTSVLEQLISTVKVFNVKTRFIRGKQLAPYNSQWLTPVWNRYNKTGIHTVCRQITTELGPIILREAITGERTKIIARVKAFDFRPVIAFIESLNNTLKAAMNIASRTRVKLIIVLHFNDGHEFDTKKLGHWLAYQKTHSIPVHYHIGENDQPTAPVIDKMRAVFENLSGDKEMQEIFTTTLRWYRDPRASMLELREWYDAGATRVARDSSSRAELGLATLLGGTDMMPQATAGAEETGDEGSDDDDSESDIDSDMMSSDDEDIE